MVNVEIVNGHAPRERSPRDVVLALARECRRVEELRAHVRQMDEDIVAELIRLGCERAIQIAGQEAREPRQRNPQSYVGPRADRKPAGYSPPASTGTAIAARLRVVAPLYDWALPNGSQLGAAGVADLDHAVAAHSVKARANMALVKFYARVRDKLLAEKKHTVADVFPERVLVALKAECGVADND